MFVEAPPLTAFRLVLADRVALLIAFLVAAAMFFFWVLGLVGLGGLPQSRFDHAMIVWLIEAELALALPIWLFLRVIDVVVRAKSWRSRAYQRVLRQ